MKRRYPYLWTIDELVQEVRAPTAQVHAHGRWLPAQRLGLPSVWVAMRLAWLVYRGKADVIAWPTVAD